MCPRVLPMPLNVDCKTRPLLTYSGGIVSVIIALAGVWQASQQVSRSTWPAIVKSIPV